MKAMPMKVINDPGALWVGAFTKIKGVYMYLPEPGTGQAVRMSEDNVAFTPLTPAPGTKLSLNKYL